MTTLVLSFLNRTYSLLQIRRITIKAWKSLNPVKIPSPIMNGSSSFLHVTRATIEAWMSLI